MTTIRIVLPVIVGVIAISIPTRAVEPPQAPSPSEYSIVELSAFSPIAINNAGVIAGVWIDPAFVGPAIWHNGVVQSLNLPTTFGTVNGISDDGAVAGYAQFGSCCGGDAAFLWQDGVGTILAIPGATRSYAYNINNLGQAAGAYDADGQSHAMVWDGEIVTTLGSLGGDDSWTNGLNDLGEAVGSSYLPDGSERAFLYSDGVMTNLGTLGGSWSTGYAIRNDGLVMGLSAVTGDVAVRPFLWQDGVMTDLGSLAGPMGGAELLNTINAHGDMVGTSQLVAGQFGYTAVVYRDGVMMDLDELIPQNSGWDLRIAQRINDAGQIVGSGILNGQFKGFLLTPVGSTPAGGSISVTPTIELPGGGTATADITFDTIEQGGTTTVTASETGPALPSGFQLPDEGLFFDVETTATFSGVVELCFSWPEGAVQDEGNVRLLHYENDAWADVTTSIDIEANVICGSVTSLSPFVVVELGYEFTGFEPPIMPDGSASIKQVNAGRVIPVKFRLLFQGEPTGEPTATIAVYHVADVDSGTIDTTDLTEDAAAGDGGNMFRYDANDEQYIFNLSTKGWAAPATYRIVVTLSDGNSYSVDFSLR